MSTNPPSGQQPDKNRFSQLIDEAFTEASKLAGSTLAPTEFYEKFLNIAVQAIGAPAAAIRYCAVPSGAGSLATRSGGNGSSKIAISTVNVDMQESHQSFIRR